jgi:hypothetical protein
MKRILEATRDPEASAEKALTTNETIENSAEGKMQGMEAGAHFTTEPLLQVALMIDVVGQDSEDEAEEASEVVEGIAAEVDTSIYELQGSTKE